jgi:cob(I)alamin adenosyltransferase
MAWIPACAGMSVFGMKIYTKTGDKGETGLADGTRQMKSEDVFWVMGEIDELCAWMGLIQTKILSNTNKPASPKLQRGEYYQILTNKNNQKSRSQDPNSKNPKIRKSENLNNFLVCDSLKRIQRNLFTINSVLARAKNIQFDSKDETEWLEKEIDEMSGELPELRNFILPGGSEIASSLHVSRAICRRVERRFISYLNLDSKDANQNEFMQIELLPYFNRLSDYLFTLARWVNFKSGDKEEIWKG